MEHAESNVSGIPPAKSLYEFDYKTGLTERIDRVHEPFYFTWIDTAWIVMLIKQGILPREDVPKIVSSVQDFWDNPKEEYSGFGGLSKYVSSIHGEAVGGSLTLSRTVPPMRQLFPVRHELMKVMCGFLDFFDALLTAADAHKDKVMPGYTHIRHAQPMTFGHYLLSVFDPMRRSYSTIEDGYRAMSLNELGCGALAGTSWPIDREKVSEYLALEGLIENANDAVAYTDGYVLLVTGLTNFITILSRFGLDLNMWSGLEYNFLQVPWLTENMGGRGKGANSHMMPNKWTNSPFVERARVASSELLGQLTEVASMGMRAPHGDGHEMLHMADGTLRALRSTHLYSHVFIYTIPRIIVHRENMLNMAKRGYSCATELANEIVRRESIDFTTGHQIVNGFVRESEAKGIPAAEADVEVLQRTSHDVLGRSIDMDEATLRKCLDPVHFVEVTDSQGGVSEKEVSRMIADRQSDLQRCRARHIDRVEKLETSRELLLRDLRELA